MCCRRTAWTSTRQHWQSLQVKQLGQPAGSSANQKTQTCLKDVAGRLFWSGKGFMPLCAAWGAFFFSPFNLDIGVWTFQPSFEIAMHTSIQSICSSCLLLVALSPAWSESLILLLPLVWAHHYEQHLSHHTQFFLMHWITQFMEKKFYITVKRTYSCSL